MKFLIFIVCVCFVSCQNDKKNIVIKIDNSVVSLNEVDYIIQQELYADLNHIYFLRQTAIDQIIEDKLLRKESEKLNIKSENILDSLVYKIINSTTLNSFILDQGFQNGVPKVKNGLLKYYEINSEEGKKWILENLQNKLRKKYFDSLKIVYNVKINLHPPKSPIVKLDNIVANYRGNLKSKVTFIEISNLDCSICKEASFLYKRIYEKYKDKVKFGFSHFSPEVTLASIASECALNQNNFWEMHDSIMSKSEEMDTSQIYNIANNLQLDLTKFKNDLNSKEIALKLSKNIGYLMNLKFYGTPTILINGHIVRDSFSELEIENLLNDELKVNNL